VIQAFKLHVTRRYWDWAEKDVEENGLPPVLVDNKVAIITVGGQMQNVNNPLAYFPYVGEIPSDFTDETNTEVRSFLSSKLRKPAHM
jgi:tyrosinase